MGFWDAARDVVRATKEKRERDRAAFYNREWTAEQARLELNKIRRRIEKYDPEIAAEETELHAVLGEALLPFLSPFLDPGDLMAKEDLLTKEELHQREDFLKERLKTLTAPQLPPPTRSKRDEQYDAAREDDQRDRRWKARMAFGRIHDLRALRQEFEDQSEELKQAKRDGMLPPEDYEEAHDLLEQDYHEQKQRIKAGNKRDIFER